MDALDPPPTWYRKADPRVGPRGGEDGGVDADDAAARIQQGTAAVTLQQQHV